MIHRLLLVALLAVELCPLPARHAGAQDIAAEEAIDPLAIPETDEGLPGAGPIRRNEWFQGVWRERRGSWMNDTEKDQHALVFLGDSITQGWGDLLAQMFPGVKLANRGISGDTTRGMLIRLDDDVLELNPSGVVMLMGTNDLADGAAPADIAGNTLLIVERLAELDPQMPIVVCKVMPSSASKDRPTDKIQEINRLVAEGVKDNEQVTIVDTFALFADDQGDAKPEEFPDLLHPNKAGYAKWSATLRPTLRKLGIKVAEPQAEAAPAN